MNKKGGKPMKWNPFEDLNALQDQINQLFEDSYIRRPPAADVRTHDQRGITWAPPVEAWETEHEIVLSVDLPGLTIGEIDLQIEGEQLVVRGERKQPEEKRNYKRREKLYGPFFRAFNLTTPINREKVGASFRNGVLEIKLPKSEAIKPRQIKINVEE
jgi:HSP20 family protein